MNLYFPYAGQGLLFFAGGSSILNCSQHLWQWKEEAVVYEIHMRDFRFHFQQDFLAYCTRPVSAHLVMACVSCSFDSFSVFLLSLKQQQNPFSHKAISPQHNEKNVFYTGKLYGLTGMCVFYALCVILCIKVAHRSDSLCYLHL